MRSVTITREPSTDQGTFGDMAEGSEHICKTIERPWLNNQHGISCVPTGSYTAKKTDTPHHGIVFQFQGVKDREGILIHPGNVMTDSEGCILVGNQRANNIKNGLPGVTSSQATFALFMKRFEIDDTIQITIV
jgi:hypothetical protein